MITPGRAALLSALFPGWGQLRSGRRTAGRLFLGLESVAWLLLVAWVPFPAFSPLFSVGAGTALIVLRLTGAFHAVRAAGGRGLALFVVTTSLTFLFAEQYALSLAIKLAAFESFKVASGAQEPTLMGPLTMTHGPPRCPYGLRHVDPEPDRVLVSKLAYAFGDVQRWDTAVFRFPLNPTRQFIKRVVGMPGEEMRIQSGEIWTRAPGESSFRVARKPRETQDTAWIDLDADTLRSRAAFVPAWTTKHAGELRVSEGELHAPADVRFSWGQPIEDGMGTAVDDRLLSCEANVESLSGRVLVEIQNGYGRFEAVWSAAGFGEVRHHANPGRRMEIATRLQPGRFHRLALAITDGRAIAWMDGREVARFDFLNVSSDLPPLSEPGGLSFEAQGAPARIRSLRVARDIHWKPGRTLDETTVVSVPPGSYFVLGDNCETSHDSRGWTRVSVTLPDGSKAHYESQADDISEDGIRGIDERGRPILIPPDSPEIAREPFPFIPRDRFTGRVYRVWWPLERARAIR